MINAGLMTSAKGPWNTPANVLDLVRKVDDIGLDPCSNAHSIVDAAVEWSLETGDDGLGNDWHGLIEGIVFVNPEYGRSIGRWVAKCMMQSAAGAEVIALLPARPDAKWFQMVWSANALCFWRGRLKFLGAPSSAPFPSVVAYWGPNRFGFALAFSAAGAVVLP